MRRYGAEAALHAHDHAQVLVGLDGRLELEVEGRPAQVEHGTGLVVPPGARHAYRAAGTARVVVIDCEPAVGLDRFRRFALPGLWHERLQGRGALLDAVVGARTVRTRRPFDLDALAAVVDADLARPWTLDDLAEHCHLSAARLRARFEERQGESPLAWLRARRLDAAERHLRAGWSLEATALHVGYASASALSAALRRERDAGARSLRAGS